jgi:hypothetical protein
MRRYSEAVKADVRRRMSPPHRQSVLLPWKVDLLLRQELPPDLLAHLERVGQCIWRQPSTSRQKPLE